MLTHLPLGRALRRFRRLHGIKQSRLAESLCVSQGSVSRWESGTHEPEGLYRERILEMVAARVSEAGDAALTRLVTSSPHPVHLVCDTTHQLLAASPARVATWRAAANDVLGQSLWRFASPDIVTAEESLEARGWFDRPFQRFEFYTGANTGKSVIIEPGMMLWETMPLADGRVGRLTTTLS
jgi:transcriptional regulator with XRE-family HTH domain